MNIKKLILIGASTGGPGQIQKIIKSIGKDFNSTIVIAQHMQNAYISSFLDYLDQNAYLDVLQARDGLMLENKKIYLLSENTEIKAKLSGLHFSINDEYHNYTPNIDLLFNSASKITQKVEIMSVLLTGIGKDGAMGTLNLYNANAKCIVENEKSSIVYGMPKAAVDLNPKLPQFDISDICEEINRF